jgi:very-short-patch-repair endonuclease
VYHFKREYIAEPPTIYYKDGDKTRFYLPDFFIPSLNLIVEIKGGNEHYQKRDERLEKLKAEATRREGFDFVQVNDKVYTPFNAYFREKVLEA